MKKSLICIFLYLFSCLVSEACVGSPLDTLGSLKDSVTRKIQNNLVFQSIFNGTQRGVNVMISKESEMEITYVSALFPIPYGKDAVRMIDIALSNEDALNLQNTINKVQACQAQQLNAKKAPKIPSPLEEPNSSSTVPLSIEKLKDMTVEECLKFQEQDPSIEKLLKETAKTLIIQYLEGISTCWDRVKNFYQGALLPTWQRYREAIHSLIVSAQTKDYDSLYQLLQASKKELEKIEGGQNVLAVREITHTEKLFLMGKSLDLKNIQEVVPGAHFISLNSMCSTCKPPMSQMVQDHQRFSSKNLVFACVKKFIGKAGDLNDDLTNISQEILSDNHASATTMGPSNSKADHSEAKV